MKKIETLMPKTITTGGSYTYAICGRIFYVIVEILICSFYQSHEYD